MLCLSCFCFKLWRLYHDDNGDGDGDGDDDDDDETQNVSEHKSFEFVSACPFPGPSLN